MDLNGESTCDDDVSSCDYSDGYRVVEELAANNTQFVEEFIRVFTKMIEKESNITNYPFITGNSLYLILGN